jgi:pimeloyl-ACP methyl ester carboxylesterase
VLIHGWESGRHRTLANAQILHALGYHVLTVDVRGHGANPPEVLPVSAGEFGMDALAGVQAALGRAEVTTVAVLGHSMGSIGAILAAAADPRVSAAILTSTPADPYRLTRQTFRLARLPIPDPIAYPLAWLTTRVYLGPRGHVVDEISATSAIRRYEGPILAIHGTEDRVVPISHLARLVHAARGSRAGREHAAPIETLEVEGGQHSWLYEAPEYRAAVGRFLATALGGPLDPEDAARVAASIDARRPPEDERPFTALNREAVLDAAPPPAPVEVSAP